MSCRTFTVPGLESSVTLPVDRYWGDGYWGLYYWGLSYWGSPTAILYGVPIERTLFVEAESRTLSISSENRTFVISECDRAFIIPGLTSTVVLPVDRYWGGGYWGLYYWGESYWGSPAAIIYGVPVERTMTISSESRTFAIEGDGNTETTTTLDGMTVSGAGSAIVNRYYQQDGTKNGKAYYKSLDGLGEIYWDFIVGAWVIRYNTTNYYLSWDDVYLPDLVSNWVGASGTAPMPTVTVSTGFLATTPASRTYVIEDCD